MTSRDFSTEKDKKETKQEAGSKILLTQPHYISIEKLESMLFEDCEWQSSILARLSMAITSDELTDYLKTFFAYQKKKGVKSRAVEDVKIHFQNWLSKKLENNNGYGNNEQKESDPRRGTEIQAASAEDYKHTV